MNKLLLLTVFLFYAKVGITQILTRTTQPFENHIRLNPAMIHFGFHHPSNRYDEPYLLAGAYYRNQWEGDLQTMGAYISTFLEEHNVGYGAYFAKDQLGPMFSNMAQGHFSYAIMNKYSKLTFGIGLGYSNIKLEMNKIEFSNGSIVNAPTPQNQFEASLGVYYLQEIKWGNYFFASLSLPKGIGLIGGGRIYEYFTPVPHFSGAIGGLIAVNENVTLEPYFLLQGFWNSSNDSLHTSLPTLGGRLSFKNVWLGAGANSTETFYTEIGCELSGIFNKDAVGRLSFSYEFPSLTDPIAAKLGRSCEIHLVYWIQNGIF